MALDFTIDEHTAILKCAPRGPRSQGLRPDIARERLPGVVRAFARAVVALAPHTGGPIVKPRWRSTVGVTSRVLGMCSYAVV